jgi:hypothetical protein
MLICVETLQCLLDVGRQGGLYQNPAAGGETDR